MRYFGALTWANTFPIALPVSTRFYLIQRPLVESLLNVKRPILELGPGRTQAIPLIRLTRFLYGSTKQANGRWYQQRWIPFWRVDILEGVDQERRGRANEAAEGSEQPVLPALPFTEAEARWVLLYEHARTGQIRPEKIRRMYQTDLEYLAATPPLTPRETEHRPGSQGPMAYTHQSRKLAGNIARAAAELHRRNLVRSALIGGSVGALIAFLFGALL